MKNTPLPLSAVLAAILATVLALVPSLVEADSLTITDNNSSLKFTRDDPQFFLGNPGDPMQLPRTIEWTVDGRRILVYPSGPSTFLDISHLHSAAHVGANQMHAQGPMIGYDTSPSAGTVTGGIVYTVEGGAAGSGISRIWEKVDIHNKTSAAISLSLTGLGFRPTRASLEVPDLSGLTIHGMTMAIVQGNTQAGSITDPPFAPVTVFPVVSFTGFNPLVNKSFSLPAGAVMTMVTELRIGAAALDIKTLDLNIKLREPRP